MKLTIYLMLGSAFLVIGMVMMYLQSGQALSRSPRWLERIIQWSFKN